MLKYLDEYSHITIEKYPINEIDRLVFAQLSYCDFSNTERFEGKPLSYVARYVFKHSDYSDATDKRFNFQIKDDRKLLYKIILSERFSCVRFLNYREKYSAEENTQFFALTLQLPDNTIFISYRGTDNTLAGWKEDCDMAFNVPIPAQKAALEYLNDMASKYDGEICLCGHSKGGNLAVYSAVFADESIQNRIRRITNFDGPGMPGEIKNTEQYLAIKDKLSVIMPRSSIVGLFFEQPENVRYIESRLVGVLQHYPYFWEVDNWDFVYTDSLAPSSRLIGSTIRTFLKKLTNEQREQFVEAVYKIIVSAKVETINELLSDLPKNTIPIAKAVLKMDAETYKLCVNVLLEFWRSVADAVRENEQKDGEVAVSE